VLEVEVQDSRIQVEDGVGWNVGDQLPEGEEYARKGGKRVLDLKTINVKAGWADKVETHAQMVEFKDISVEVFI
jgi:hypothetical protein